MSAGLAIVVLLPVRWSGAPAGPQQDLALAPSVLVSPFEAGGSAPDVETLASGITAELIADLMRFADLRLYTFQESLRRDAERA